MSRETRQAIRFGYQILRIAGGRRLADDPGHTLSRSDDT
jgi:hypothetical protein